MSKNTKFIYETVKAGLNSFVGQPLNATTTHSIKAQVLSTLRSQEAQDVFPPFPNMEEHIWVEKDSDKDLTVVFSEALTEHLYGLRFMCVDLGEVDLNE
jgi:hypothetical protein